MRFDFSDTPLYLGFLLQSKKLTLNEVKDRINFYNEWANKEVIPEFSIDEVMNAILRIKQMSEKELFKLTWYADYSEANYKLGLDVVKDAVKSGYKKAVNR